MLRKILRGSPEPRTYRLWTPPPGDYRQALSEVLQQSFATQQRQQCDIREPDQFAANQWVATLHVGPTAPQTRQIRLPQPAAPQLSTFDKYLRFLGKIFRSVFRLRRA